MERNIIYGTRTPDGIFHSCGWFIPSEIISKEGMIDHVSQNFDNCTFIDLTNNMDRTDRIKTFERELGWIKDENKRKFAELLIENAPDYFFTIPASTSKKYHPPFDLVEGGLVNHTKCVMFMAHNLATAIRYDDNDHDLLLIGALAHDMWKLGGLEGYPESQHTIWEHPQAAASYVKAMYKSNEALLGTRNDMIKVCKAIHSHMGIFAHDAEYLKEGKEPMPKPETDFEKMLHASDYLASRRELRDISFYDIEPTGVLKKPLDEMTKEDLEQYVIGFGKYKGLQLKEINDEQYFDWIIGQDEFKNKEAQEAIKKYRELLE